MSDAERCKAWRLRNIEKVRAYNEAYRGQHQPERSAYNAEWRKKNPDAVAKYRERERAEQKHLTAERKAYKVSYYQTAHGRAKVMLNGAKKRASDSGVAFDLDIEWVSEHLAPLVCEATGLPMTLDRRGDHRKNPWAPSIDRVHAGLGYTKANCRVVCWIFNLAKNDFDEADVETMARAYIDRKVDR